MKKIFMSFEELYRSRKTAFDFKKTKVSKNKLKIILEAGRWAPSAANIQPWKFIVIDKPKLISEVMGACYYGWHRSDPPLLIALIADIPDWKKQTKKIFRDDESSKNDLYLSVAMPGLNMVYQAQDLGVDTVFLSPDEKTVKKILKVPSNYRVCLMIGLGYEKDKHVEKESERKALKKIVSYNRFKK